ncbi:MAG: non-ribosomal peptide synthetase, partial [Lysobacter sp.]
TLYMTVLAAWMAVLARMAGQDEVVVGTAVANRSRAQIERLIGFFVNTQAIRADVGGSAGELLRQVRARVLDAQDHQDLPFEQVVEIVNPPRSLAHGPVFQVLMAWQTTIERELELPGLDVSSVAMPCTRAKLDMSLELGESGDGIGGRLEYSTALFDRATAERYAGYLRRMLEAMAEDDAQLIADVDLVDADERRQLLSDFNATRAEYPEHACIHELFQAQVARTPEATALVHAGQSLSYAELNRRANRLAHHLIGLGLRPDDRIGLCVERGAAMVVAVLAALKAGGAYVPLDPNYPSERLAQMLEDSAPVAVLGSAQTRGSLPSALNAQWIDLHDDAAWSQGAEHDPDPAALGLTSNHLAYLIYTSGSTGTPKGVMIEHRNAVNFLTWAAAEFGATGLQRTLFATSLNFDLSVYECFAPLSVGGCIEIVDDALALRPDTPVGLVNSVPSAMQAWLDTQALGADVHTVNVAGEPLKRELAERLFAQTPVQTLCNLYGPSETTTYSTWVAMDRADGFVPHIGRPIANTQVYLLDAQQRPVPLGAIGELYIGGAGVARGYLNRPELTAERFTANPFAAGERMYRTGDLGRWRADGNLDYLGRNDFQVKLRGFRIELGEIESQLLAYAAVREAVVVLREDAPGDKRLVAYVVIEGELDQDALRKHLATRLPDYMLPSAYVNLERLPRTANGKLDRKALPAPRSDAYASQDYEAPQGEVETALARIWAELLGRDRIGRHDHFFGLGGHSLLAVTLVARMRRAGLHVDVRAVFVAPTLQALAAQVGSDVATVEVPANLIEAGCERIAPSMLPLVKLQQTDIDRIAASVPGGAANIQDIYPLAPLQEGFLFHYLLESQGDVYLSATALASDSRERIERYAQALQQVIERHDILRTSFFWDDLDEPVQVVWRDAPLQVEQIALDPADGDILEQLRGRFDPRHYRADIRQAPLWRLVWAFDEPNRRWVALELSHHLIDDGVTLDLVRQEVGAILAGQGPQLAAPIPFRDFVAQARLGVSREEHENFFRGMLGDVGEPTAAFG